MKPPEAYDIETGDEIDDPCGNAGDGIDVLHPVVPTEKAEKQREHVDHNIGQERLAIAINSVLDRKSVV